MKFKRLGIEWGAAHSEAHPVLVTSADGSQLLVYENSNAGLTIEIPRSAEIGIGKSSVPQHQTKDPRSGRNETDVDTFHIKVEEGF